jgi:hypothetical protein
MEFGRAFFGRGGGDLTCQITEGTASGRTKNPGVLFRAFRGILTNDV